MRVRDAQFEIARSWELGVGSWEEQKPKRGGSMVEWLKGRAYKPDTRRPNAHNPSQLASIDLLLLLHASQVPSIPSWIVVCLWLLFAVQVYNFNALPLDCWQWCVDVAVASVATAVAAAVAAASVAAAALPSAPVCVGLLILCAVRERNLAALTGVAAAAFSSHFAPKWNACLCFRFCWSHHMLIHGVEGTLYYSFSEPRLAKYVEKRELGSFRQRNLMTHTFWRHLIGKICVCQFGIILAVSCFL